METFSLSDAIITTGASKPLLIQWLKHGWIQAFDGTGSEDIDDARFSREELYHIAFLKKIADAGISIRAALEKINIHALCQTIEKLPRMKVVGIAFSRIVTVEGDHRTLGAWIISPEMDRQTGWESLSLIEKRLEADADDVYILNFIKLKSRIDTVIKQIRGVKYPGNQLGGSNARRIPDGKGSTLPWW